MYSHSPTHPPPFLHSPHPFTQFPSKSSTLTFKQPPSTYPQFQSAHTRPQRVSSPSSHSRSGIPEDPAVSSPPPLPPRKRSTAAESIATIEFPSRLELAIITYATPINPPPSTPRYPNSRGGRPSIPSLLPPVNSTVIITGADNPSDAAPASSLLSYRFPSQQCVSAKLIRDNLHPHTFRCFLCLPT